VFLEKTGEFLFIITFEESGNRKAHTSAWIAKKVIEPDIFIECLIAYKVKKSGETIRTHGIAIKKPVIKSLI